MVSWPFRYCFDSRTIVTPKPVVEPWRLRHDQRERQHANDERADERDDLEDPANRADGAGAVLAVPA